MCQLGSIYEFIWWTSRRKQLGKPKVHEPFISVHIVGIVCDIIWDCDKFFLGLISAVAGTLRKIGDGNNFTGTIFTPLEFYPSAQCHAGWTEHNIHQPLFNIIYFFSIGLPSHSLPIIKRAQAPSECVYLSVGLLPSNVTIYSGIFNAATVSYINLGFVFHTTHTHRQVARRLFVPAAARKHYTRMW